MPATKPTLNKTSENRRATKPIMEKRRRARINQCLGDLKTLILDALNKDPSRHSKLEKADILEMTVRHLQNVQRQQMAAAISTDPTVLNKFKAGFNECANEVSRYINRIEGVEPGLRQRLLGHLSACLTTMNAATSFAVHPPGVAFPGMTTFPGLLSPLQSLSVQIPGGVAVPTMGFLPSTSHGTVIEGGDINNNTNTSSSGTNTSISAAAASKLFAGLPIIPSRLPNGDFAFLLPSQVLTSNRAQVTANLLNFPSVSSDVASSSGVEGSRASQSSWPPSSPISPSSRISVSPSTSISSALSPTGSEAGSDFLPDPIRHQDDGIVNLHKKSPVKGDIMDNVNGPAVESDSVWRPW